MKQRAWFPVLALLAFAVPLYHHDKTLAHDWDYFNSLSWLIRTSLLKYHELNVQDPWGCGGLDVWANPQQRMLSPLGLLDLALPPHWANLAGLVLHAFAGLIGAFLLFKRYGARNENALVCAFLFINGSFFGLHFVVGHIPFGGLQLLPWAALAVFYLDDRRAQFLLACLFSFMLVDGAIYALIFSGYTMLTLMLVHRIRPRFHPLFALFVLAVAAVKVIPVLAATGRGELRTDASVVGLSLLGRMLFNPFQYVGDEYLFEHLRFHEFGCYIGLPLLVVTARHLRPFLVPIALWLWTATAWLTPFNPWSLHRLIPLVNLAHVQSRVLLIVFLLVLIVAAQHIKARWVLALLLVESIAVRTYTWEHAYRFYSRAPLPATPIEKHTLATTVLTEEKPLQYQREGIGVHNCYEPSLRQEKRGAAANTFADYLGEAYVFPPETARGTAEIVEYVPARITLKYAVEDHAIIVINTRHNGGWVSDGAEIVSSARDDLLALRPKENSGTLVLKYRPSYRPYQALAGVIAVLAFCASAWVCRREHASEAQQSDRARAAEA